ESSGRPPSAGEHRAMAMLSLAHGAQGLLHHGYFFAAAPSREKYYLPSDAPDLWAGMKDTNELVNLISPAIVAGQYRGCEISGPVHVGAWDVEDRTYVLAANAQPAAALSTFAVPGAEVTKLYRVTDGMEAPRTQNGLFADDVPAYGARIYCTEPPETDARTVDASG
ncbi:MAG TPA: hypothetical protein QGH10_06220, partial [Armatimonadota bacterium]|nr:hypothetical protein [Armatimonadota bacterium]